VVAGRYVRLPPWGPVYSYTRPARRAPASGEPRLLGVPVEQPRERAAPREERIDPTAESQPETPTPLGVPADAQGNAQQSGAQPNVGDPANSLDLLGQPAQSQQLQVPPQLQQAEPAPSETPAELPPAPPDTGVAPPIR
jgi:hypothetical protein